MGCNKTRWWCQRLQTKPHGRYSVERMCALREYSSQASLWHVFFVFGLSTVPSLATIIFLDSLPLQDPSLNWNDNSVFWIRVVLGTFLLSYGVMLQTQSLVPAGHLTKTQCAFVSGVATSSYLVVGMLLAKYWVFPVPFMMVVGNPAWSLGLFGTMVLVIGRAKVATDPDVKAQLKRFNSYLNVSTMLLVIYPVYNAIFRSLEGAAQFAFLFLLPVIKFIMKKATISVVSGVEDLVFVVALAVDIFNALFQAKCMQSSGSHWTTMGIVGIDAVQNIFSLRGLLRKLDDVQIAITDSVSSGGLLDDCFNLMQKPEGLELLELRLQSWTHVHVTKKTEELLRNIELEQENQLFKRQFALRELPNLPHGLSSNTVMPFASSPEISDTDKCNRGFASIKPKSRGSVHPISRTQQTALLKKTLELLWKCESVLLVEYIEAVVPMLYCISVSILYYLPSAKYYLGMAELTPKQLASTVTSILIYSLLEFVSLIYIHVILQRKFKLSALHQLAFVLKSEQNIVQGVSLSWVVIVFGFTLVHYGKPTRLL